MSFLLWQRDADIAIGTSRLVLRADEVPALREAHQLRDEIEALRRDEAVRVEAACEAARAQGRAAGRAQAEQALRDEVAAQLAALSEQAERQRMQLRGEVAALALQVVRKLMAEVAADVRLAALAEVAAADLLPTPTLALRVHPDRWAAVRARLGSGVPFEVRADAACALDDCCLDTEFGSVQAALDVQLVRLAEVWGVNPVAADQAAQALS